MKPYQINIADEVAHYQSSLGRAQSIEGAAALSQALSALGTVAIAERLERIAELLEKATDSTGSMRINLEAISQ